MEKSSLGEFKSFAPGHPVLEVAIETQVCMTPKFSLFFFFFSISLLVSFDSNGLTLLSEAFPHSRLPALSRVLKKP